MTRTEVIELAKQAGIKPYLENVVRREWHGYEPELEHFANLVAAKEREACAALFEADKFADTSTDYRIWYNEQMDMSAERIKGKT